MSHTVNVSCYSKRQMERRAARSWSASSAGGQRAIINLQMTFYVGDLQIIKIVIKNYNSNFLFRSHTSKHFENIWDFFIQRIFHVSIKKVSHFFSIFNEKDQAFKMECVSTVCLREEIMTKCSWHWCIDTAENEC